MDDKTDMKAFNSQDKAPETEKEQVYTVIV